MLLQFVTGVLGWLYGSVLSLHWSMQAVLALVFVVNVYLVAAKLRHRTAAQVMQRVSLAGRVAIVTGASSGIGLETARGLTLGDCLVVMACRSVKRAEAAVEELVRNAASKEEQQRLRNSLVCLPLDLADVKSIHAFVGKFKALKVPLHTLVLNAGCYGMRKPTLHGLEPQFGVAHFGHFVLTRLLLNKLLASADGDVRFEKPTPRVVLVSSHSHYDSTPINHELVWKLPVAPDAPASQKELMQRYAQAKMANVLMALALRERYPKLGVFALHPGSMIATNIGRHWWVARLLMWMLSPYTKNVQQGAATSVYCAVWPELDESQALYFSDCAPCKHNELVTSAAATELWEKSEEKMRELLPQVQVQ